MPVLSEYNFNELRINQALEGISSTVILKDILQIHNLSDQQTLNKIGRYDIKGKQLLKTLDKNYIVDLGFRNMLLGYRDADRGHILENLVFLELIRRHYNVYIGKIGDTEIDFLAEKPNEKIYIQVTESLSSQKTRERELRPLLGINDNYEKIILTYDRDFISSENGIKIINIIDWMIG